MGRRGGSGRGRKQPVGKKDSNNHNAGSKKNSDVVKTIYSSDENSSEVGKLILLNNLPIYIYMSNYSRRIGQSIKLHRQQRKEKKL